MTVAPFIRLKRATKSMYLAFNQSPIAESTIPSGLTTKVNKATEKPVDGVFPTFAPYQSNLKGFDNGVGT
jgi:hypothetical protein